MRALAHIQPPLHVHAVGDQFIDLRKQRFRVHHDAIAYGTPHPRMENAAGDLVEDERRVTDMHRVTRVGAALIANNPIGFLGQNIHQLAFAFIAPLCTHYHNSARR